MAPVGWERVTDEWGCAKWKPGPASCMICIPELDDALCAAARRTCGAFETTDRCGERRSIASCGSCGQAPEECFGGTCVMVDMGETNEAFCMRLEAECGVVTGQDNMGMERRVDCGSCTGGKTCDAATRRCQ